MAIGIFDSGVGGLSVYKKLKGKYKDTKFIYFADLANFPYGEKTDEEILSYAKNIVEFLIKEQVTSIIVACNTASAVALKTLKKDYNINFIGMIDPITSELNKSFDGNLSLIATSKTVRSKEYLKKLDNKIKYSVAAPKLVEYAEKINKIGIENIVKEYIDEDMVKNTNIILGCTHFPLLEKYILKVYPNAKLLDPADYIIKNIDLDGEKGTDIFYTSGNLEYFRIQLTNILGKENLDVRVYKWNS